MTLLLLHLLDPRRQVPPLAHGAPSSSGGRCRDWGRRGLAVGSGGSVAVGDAFLGVFGLFLLLLRRRTS